MRNNHAYQGFTPPPLNTIITKNNKGAFSTLALLLLFLSNTFAQLPCLGVSSSCVSGLGDPSTYKCIDATSAAIQGSMQNAINQNIIVSAAMSATTVQRVVIKGLLRVDISDPNGYTFPPGSVVVFADNTSELSVRPGKKLTIQGSTVTGCSTMWNQIDVWPSATLILENSNVFDALTAINVQPSATISLTGNQFKRNLVSVRLGTGVTGQINYSSGGGISGNTFAGEEALKAPHAGFFPSQGVVVNAINNITIGGTAQNLFRNYTNTFGSLQGCIGLLVIQSAVSVYNTRFQDVGRSNIGTSNASIAVNSGTLTLSGLGNTGSDLTTIVYSTSSVLPSAGDGIQLFSSNATVTNTKFEGAKYGIYSYRLNGSSPSTFLNVSNSNFVGFAKDAITAVVNPAQFIPLNMSSFLVQNCFFDDNSLITGLKNGVKALSGAPTSGKGFRFIANKMYHRARPTDDNYKLHCFNMTLIEGGVGSNNELYDEGTLFFSSPNEFKGVAMSNCKNFSWNGNSIIGNAIPGFNNEFAFDIADSPQCYYNCNNTDLLLYGMRFSNICLGSGLSRNSFNNHATAGVGLVQDGTEIGQQIYKDNTWNSGSGREAFMRFTGYNPFNISDIQQVRKSLFRITTPNQNSSRWADPRVVESGGNDPNWFLGPNTEQVPLPIACSMPAPRSLDEVEKALLTGVHYPYRGFAANTWESEFQLFDKLATNPDLQPVGSPEYNWYQSKFYTNVGKFARVYRGMVDMTEPAPSGSTSQLLSDLNAIVTTAPYEQNLKSVLQVAITDAASETGTITEAQLLNLQAISHQCRYEGGIGVALARAMLQLDAVLEGDCPPESQEHGSNDQELAIQAKVYPNPLQDAFFITLGTPLNDGKVRLYNLSGKLINEWAATGEQLFYTVNGLQNGIYLLEISDASSIAFRSKIAILK